jgi:hypothetical protein
MFVDVVFRTIQDRQIEGKSEVGKNYISTDRSEAGDLDGFPVVGSRFDLECRAMRFCGGNSSELSNRYIIFGIYHDRQIKPSGRIA